MAPNLDSFLLGFPEMEEFSLSNLALKKLASGYYT